MDKKLNNKNMMYISTNKVLENNKAIWELIPIFVILVGEFQSFLNRIAAMAIAAGVDLTGVTGSKNETLLSLRKMVFTFLSMLSLFAFRTRNLELHAKVTLTEGDVNKKRQNELLLLAQQIIKWLEQYKTELTASYGLNEAALTKLKEQTLEFSKQMPEPDAKYTERKVALEHLKALFDETDQFLEEQMDKAMDTLHESEKEFYAAYYNARVIKDLGIRHESATVNGAAKKDTVE